MTTFILFLSAIAMGSLCSWLIWMRAFKNMCYEATGGAIFSGLLTVVFMAFAAASALPPRENSQEGFEMTSDEYRIWYACNDDACRIRTFQMFIDYRKKPPATALPNTQAATTGDGL